ncbi:MAG: N-acetyltransferase [Gemmatimonadetes bacterium]|nr:N-acetyltransferase [Gemmatimonadota bacterium]
MSNLPVSSRARIGKNVSIGPFTIVHDNVVIEDNTRIDSHCVIGTPTPLAEGRPLTIGPDSHIRSHSIFYEGSEFGPHLVTGHAVLVRENCKAGSYLQVGSRSEIQGPCTIGNYVRLHSEVHVSESTQIGHFVWLFPRVQFTNDPLPPSNIREAVRLKDMVVIATGSILLPGITIGLGAFVGAGSVVRSDVPDIHCVSGNPALIFSTLDKLFNYEHGLSYPWPKHFIRGYPEESLPLMDTIVGKIGDKIKDYREIKAGRLVAREGTSVGNDEG